MIHTMHSLQLRSLAAVALLGFAAVACDKPNPTPQPTAQVQAPSQPAVQPAPQASPTPQPAAQAQPTAPSEPPVVAAVPSAFDQNGQRRTCAQQPARAGFDCVDTPNGPAQVIQRTAAADVDPCAGATCLPNTRCEVITQSVGGTSYRLPHCEATAPLANDNPTRNPCAAYLCPLGYACTAPADAPYCMPQSAAWQR